MVDHMIYTSKELREIQDGAAGYDKAAESQISAANEYAERPLKRRDVIKEIHEEIERDNLDTLRFLAEDIGVLSRIRETWRNQDDLAAFVDMIIEFENERMRVITREIMRWKKRKLSNA